MFLTEPYHILCPETESSIKQESVPIGILDYDSNINRTKTWSADDVIGGERTDIVGVGNGRQRADNGM